MLITIYVTKCKNLFRLTLENAGYYSRVFTGYRKWSFPYSPGTSDGQMPKVSASVGSREGACPPYFWAKLRPEGPEKKCILRPPPSLSQGLDDRPHSLTSESATARATLFFCIWLTLIEPGCSLPRSRFWVSRNAPPKERGSEGHSLAPRNHQVPQKSHLP